MSSPSRRAHARLSDAGRAAVSVAQLLLLAAGVDADQSARFIQLTRASSHRRRYATSERHEGR